MARQQGVSKEQVEKEFFEKVRPSSLLKRFETTEEVAAVVAFVASTQATGINGAAIARRRRRRSQYLVRHTEVRFAGSPPASSAPFA